MSALAACRGPRAAARSSRGARSSTVRVSASLRPPPSFENLITVSAARVRRSGPPLFFSCRERVGGEPKFARAPPRGDAPHAPRARRGAAVRPAARQERGSRAPARRGVISRPGERGSREKGKSAGIAFPPPTTTPRGRAPPPTRRFSPLSSPLTPSSPPPPPLPPTQTPPPQQTNTQRYDWLSTGVGALSVTTYAVCRGQPPLEAAGLTVVATVAALVANELLFAPPPPPPGQGGGSGSRGGGDC
jgi:hypothetical protein